MQTEGPQRDGYRVLNSINDSSYFHIVIFNVSNVGVFFMVMSPSPP